MWRVSMQTITDALSAHYNFRTVAQLADFLELSRQHLHIANKQDRLVPDKLLKACIKREIDITRLLRDGKAVKISDVDYSNTDIELSHYEEGQVLPHSKKTIPKWMADIVFKRDVDINESLAMLVVTSDELEPKLPRDSLLFLDTKRQEPQGGHYYLNLNGYGVIRRMLKAKESNAWILKTKEEYEGWSPSVLNEDFQIIGKILSMSTRV